MPLEFTGIHQEILDDETSEIDVEGGRMSGKTWLCAAKIMRSCLKHPGIWWLACRYSGTETDNQLRPVLVQVWRQFEVYPVWNGDESAYHFPEVDGKVSKVFCYGLKTQSRDQRYAKIRGSGVGGLYIDQAEELPEDIGTECRALLRQPGFPHQLIFSPNPPDEEHFLADQFPDDSDSTGRKYYRLSLYDNKHNLPSDSIEKLERAFPSTHAKHKSLILGMRGPNITGPPVYEHAFDRSLHVTSLAFDSQSPLLEGIHVGQKHPVWLSAQRTYFGGLTVQGAVIGKKLFLDDFLIRVQRYRSEWFSTAKKIQTCCDPPPAKQAGQMRYSNIATMREFGFKPTWAVNATAPDVREAVIQSLGGMMNRRSGGVQAFQVTDDPLRFMMASNVVEKPTKLFIDSLEGSYVWDSDGHRDNEVSVSNKKIRHPKSDQWTEGLMRCLENIFANFCASKESEQERSKRVQEARATTQRSMDSGHNSWLRY